MCSLLVMVACVLLLVSRSGGAFPLPMMTGTSFQVREFPLLANCEAAGSDQMLLCETQWGHICLYPC